VESFPYSAVDEIVFMRVAAVSRSALKNFQTDVFYSDKK
jgi:hypothetical protein